MFSVNLEDGSEEQEKTAYVSALDHVSKKEFGPVVDLCTDEINAGKLLILGQFAVI